MSTLRKRLADIEELQAFRDWQESERQFDGRSDDELLFFGVYGYFPDSLEDELPERQEFTVAGVRIVISVERLG